MVTVLITSFLLLAVVSFAIYRWQRVASNDNASQPLPPTPDFKGLFADSVAEEQSRFNAVQLEEELEKKRLELFARASQGDKNALPEAHQSGDAKLYDDVLNELVRRAENPRQIFALASYIARGDNLPVTKTLADAFIENWKNSPDRRSTSEMLHLAAMVGDAEFYQNTIKLVLKYWHSQRLHDVTSDELAQLIESEFWLIPSNARESGAGFLLKRELAKLRRELAATTNRGDE